jgi:hypothetical protein
MGVRPVIGSGCVKRSLVSVWNGHGNGWQQRWMARNAARPGRVTRRRGPVLATNSTVGSTPTARASRVESTGRGRGAGHELEGGELQVGGAATNSTPCWSSSTGARRVAVLASERGRGASTSGHESPLPLLPPTPGHELDGAVLVVELDGAVPRPRMEIDARPLESRITQRTRFVGRKAY